MVVCGDLCPGLEKNQRVAWFIPHPETLSIGARYEVRFEPQLAKKQMAPIRLSSVESRLVFHFWILLGVRVWSLSCVFEGLDDHPDKPNSNKAEAIA